VGLVAAAQGKMLRMVSGFTENRRMQTIKNDLVANCMRAKRQSHRVGSVWLGHIVEQNKGGVGLKIVKRLAQQKEERKPVSDLFFFWCFFFYRPPLPVHSLRNGGGKKR
jgi:hypothetical protein